MERPDTKTNEAEITAQYAALEQALKDSNPGVFEMLQVYGGYDQAVKLAEQYLAPPQAQFPTVLNNSNF
jgi:hypothetical protein